MIFVQVKYLNKKKNKRAQLNCFLLGLPQLACSVQTGTMMLNQRKQNGTKTNSDINNKPGFIAVKKKQLHWFSRPKAYSVSHSLSLFSTSEHLRKNQSGHWDCPIYQADFLSVLKKFPHFGMGRKKCLPGWKAVCKHNKAQVWQKTRCLVWGTKNK